MSRFTGDELGVRSTRSDVSHEMWTREFERDGWPMSASNSQTGRIRALLLNAGHEPLAVLAARRALLLVLSGKAECVVPRAAGEMYRSQTLMVCTPAVIRLNHFVRVPYSPLSSVSRAGVLRRDLRRCAYCRKPGETIDHVVPRSRGGGHSWENCVACCTTCNVRKADRLLSEIGWSLPFVPAPPRRVGAGRLWLEDDTDPAWRPWLVQAA
jgi:5-methylcytosine-specific restriction endonuclease McrA